MSAIYRDPATGWLYRVSPQPGQDDCFCIEYLDPASSAAWKFWPAEAKTRATSRKTIVEVFEARAKQNGWELVSDTNGCAPGLPEICRGCLCWKCGNVDCDLICDHNDREVHECGNFGSIGMGESCEYYIPKKEEYEPCQNQLAPNGDAAATTAGSAVPEPAETSTTPTDANTLPAPGCPADAGSATQSLSAAGPASLEAEPEATPFDYSGLDAQTVATLHSAENIIRSARKEYVIKVADAVGMAHDELVANCDKRGNQYSENTFRAWCASVGIGKDAAYRLLQVSTMFDKSTPREQKVLEELSPSLLYATAKPSAPAELVQAVKDGDITTHKQYQAALERIKTLENQNKSLLHSYEAEKGKAEAARAQAKHAQEKADALETRPVMSELFDAKERIKELEGEYIARLHETEKERDGARQALAAAKLRGDKLKEENDALREQPIRGDFADADEIDRRAQEKAEAMTAEYRDQIAELQDRAETGDANACYDQVILASRALENAWTLAKSAYKRLPAGMRAYPREMLHNAFAKFEEELKCL